jgi:hypothetical protein
MREHAIPAPVARPRTATAAARIPRKAVRYFAALAALAAGVLYLLIATGTLQVIDPAAVAEEAPIFIPIAAAAAFFLGTILILAFDRRLTQILGAAVQVTTIVGYFAVAPNRTPSYEVWGIVIKVVQVVALIALAYLAVRAPRAPAPRQAKRAR